MAAEDPEERECRICRGEYEENNPLYVPCDCRGSIRYCHEGCLTQWLDRSGKSQCELCGIAFEFAPVYAEGAPDTLPVGQLVAVGVAYLWKTFLPLVLRICASTFLWLGVAPLATCMLYRAWIHRPSELPVAWSGARLLEELASGLVIVACIVVSFLSLLSFTDYMRVRWELLDLQRDQDEEVEAAPRPPAPIQAPPPLNDEDDDEDDEIELHVAVDELLGLRGPLVNVARNVSWLVVFNAAYLGVFAFAPFAVGRAAARGFARGLGQHVDEVPAETVVPDAARAWGSQALRLVAAGLDALAAANGTTVRTYTASLVPRKDPRERFAVSSSKLHALAERLSVSAQRTVPPPATLRVADLGRVALGYAALGLVACVGRELFRAAPDSLRSKLPARALRRAERAFDAAAAAAKVAAVLALKMVVLPTILGAGLEAATISADGSSIAQAARALGGGAAGAALARWVLGITFMLVVTVAVLQLREQLHPAVLGQWVRPHEPRPDLLAALLAEPALAHARRLLTSLLIYAGLLGVLVALPFRIVAPLVEAYWCDFRVAYAAPGAQIPLELLCFHLALLTLLERLKKRIGDGQRWYLAAMCSHLHLEAYLLPANGPDLSEDTLEAHRAFDAAAAALGRPQAPPERWAWADERPSLREVQLAPRALRPPASQLLLFAGASWAGCVLASALIALVPLVLGRAALRVLRCDPGHDPASLAAGWALALFACGPWLEGRVRPQVEPPANGTAGSRNVACGLAFVVLWFAVLPLSIGLAYDVFFKADGAYGDDFVLGFVVLQIGATARARCAAHAREKNVDIDGWSNAALEARAQLMEAFSQRRVAPLDFGMWCRALALPALGVVVAVAAAPVSVLLYYAWCWPAGLGVALVAVLACAYDAGFDATRRVATYRALVAAGLGAAVAARGVGPLARWLDAARGAARDVRYLVGLRLQNHVVDGK